MTPLPSRVRVLGLIVAVIVGTVSTGSYYRVDPGAAGPSVVRCLMSCTHVHAKDKAACQKDASRCMWAGTQCKDRLPTLRTRPAACAIRDFGRQGVQIFDPFYGYLQPSPRAAQGDSPTDATCVPREQADCALFPSKVLCHSEATPSHCWWDPTIARCVSPCSTAGCASDDTRCVAMNNYGCRIKCSTFDADDPDCLRFGCIVDADPPGGGGTAQCVETCTRQSFGGVGCDALLHLCIQKPGACAERCSIHTLEARCYAVGCTWIGGAVGVCVATLSTTSLSTESECLANFPAGTVRWFPPRGGYRGVCTPICELETDPRSCGASGHSSGFCLLNASGVCALWKVWEAPSGATSAEVCLSAPVGSSAACAHVLYPSWIMRVSGTTYPPWASDCRTYAADSVRHLPTDSWGGTLNIDRRCFAVPPPSSWAALQRSPSSSSSSTATNDRRAFTCGAFSQATCEDPGNASTLGGLRWCRWYAGISVCGVDCSIANPVRDPATALSNDERSRIFHDRLAALECQTLSVTCRWSPDRLCVASQHILRTRAECEGESAVHTWDGTSNSCKLKASSPSRCDAASGSTDPAFCTELPGCATLRATETCRASCRLLHEDSAACDADPKCEWSASESACLDGCSEIPADPVESQWCAGVSGSVGGQSDEATPLQVDLGGKLVRSFAWSHSFGFASVSFRRCRVTVWPAVPQARATCAPACDARRSKADCEPAGSAAEICRWEAAASQCRAKCELIVPSAFPLQQQPATNETDLLMFRSACESLPDCDFALVKQQGALTTHRWTCVSRCPPRCDDAAPGALAHCTSLPNGRCAPNCSTLAGDNATACHSHAHCVWRAASSECLLRCHMKHYDDEAGCAGDPRCRTAGTLCADADCAAFPTLEACSDAQLDGDVSCVWIGGRCVFSCERVDAASAACAVGSTCEARDASCRVRCSLASRPSECGTVVTSGCLWIDGGCIHATSAAACGGASHPNCGATCDAIASGRDAVAIRDGADADVCFPKCERLDPVSCVNSRFACGWRANRAPFCSASQRRCMLRSGACVDGCESRKIKAECELNANCVWYATLAKSLFGSSIPGQCGVRCALFDANDTECRQLASCDFVGQRCQRSCHTYGTKATCNAATQHCLWVVGDFGDDGLCLPNPSCPTYPPSGAACRAVFGCAVTRPDAYAFFRPDELPPPTPSPSRSALTTTLTGTVSLSRGGDDAEDEDVKTGTATRRYQGATTPTSTLPVSPPPPSTAATATTVDPPAPTVSTTGAPDNGPERTASRTVNLTSRVASRVLFDTVDRPGVQATVRLGVVAVTAGRSISPAVASPVAATRVVRADVLLEAASRCLLLENPRDSDDGVSPEIPDFVFVDITGLEATVGENRDNEVSAPAGTGKLAAASLASVALCAAAVVVVAVGLRQQRYPAPATAPESTQRRRQKPLRQQPQQTANNPTPVGPTLRLVLRLGGVSAALFSGVLTPGIAGAAATIASYPATPTTSGASGLATLFTAVSVASVACVAAVVLYLPRRFDPEAVAPSAASGQQATPAAPKWEAFDVALRHWYDGARDVANGVHRACALADLSVSLVIAAVMGTMPHTTAACTTAFSATLLASLLLSGYAVVIRPVGDRLDTLAMAAAAGLSALQSAVSLAAVRQVDAALASDNSPTIRADALARVKPMLALVEFAVIAQYVVLIVQPAVSLAVACRAQCSTGPPKSANPPAARGGGDPATQQPLLLVPVAAGASLQGPQRRVQRSTPAAANHRGRGQDHHRDDYVDKDNGRAGAPPLTGAAAAPIGAGDDQRKVAVARNPLGDGRQHRFQQPEPNLGRDQHHHQRRRTERDAARTPHEGDGGLGAPRPDKKDNKQHQQQRPVRGRSRSPQHAPEVAKCTPTSS